MESLPGFLNGLRGLFEYYFCILAPVEFSAFLDAGSCGVLVEFSASLDRGKKLAELGKLVGGSQVASGAVCHPSVAPVIATAAAYLALVYVLDAFV